MTLARSQLRELRTTADTSQARLLDHSQRQGKESSLFERPGVGEVSDNSTGGTQTRKRSPGWRKLILSPLTWNAPPHASLKWRVATKSSAPRSRLFALVAKAPCGAWSTGSGAIALLSAICLRVS